jgi:hypothetical protein
MPAQKAQAMADHTSLKGGLDTAVGSFDGISLSKKVKREFVA